MKTKRRFESRVDENDDDLLESYRKIWKKKEEKESSIAHTHTKTSSLWLLAMLFVCGFSLSPYQSKQYYYQRSRRYRLQAKKLMSIVYVGCCNQYNKINKSHSVVIHKYHFGYRLSPPHSYSQIKLLCCLSTQNSMHSIFYSNWYVCDTPNN